ncbi:hypothetical protein [Vibrio mediterranei]|uniref:hypothetical protein n=1 Tax=Vibrio mediterranei TaxID=689 RepID=UPI00117DA9B3|nr:hypothetical protein [Vibrio mediterranei]
MRTRKSRFILGSVVLSILLSGCGDESLQSQLMTPPSAGNETGGDIIDGNESGGDLSENESAYFHDLVIFSDQSNAHWAAYDCCAGTEAELVDDGTSYQNVMRFSVTETPAVLGFERTSNAGPLNIEPMVNDGEISFDLKVEQQPSGGETTWKLKVESASGSAFYEYDLQLPMTNTWQHESFPLSLLQSDGIDLTSIEKVLIFPEWGTGAGSSYLVDNLKFALQGTASSNDLILSLSEPMVDFGGAITQISADNPTALASMSAVSTIPKVVKTTKSTEAELWAGTTIGDETIVALANDRNQMTLWVYSPISGMPILLKAEERDNSASYVEALAMTTSSNQWEQLTFDFGSVTPAISESAGYNKVSVFFNFNQVSEEELVIYWDDLRLLEATESVNPVPSAPFLTIDFESEPLPLWTVFENGTDYSLPAVGNPLPDEVNSSETAIHFTAQQDGMPWAGMFTESIEPFSLESTNSVIRIKMFKDKISPIQVKLDFPNWQDENGNPKLDDNNNQMTFSADITVSNQKVGEWEEITFDLSHFITSEPNKGLATKLVIIPDFPEQIDGSFPGREQESNIYIDDIVFGNN